MNELLAKYPAVLDVATVAEILEVTPATVRRLLKANVIPSVKVGRLTRVAL
ncbi:helix-turn-helix domain-containing protein [Eshraghiella crossota]|uniref:helix-turn-helix domain-containing protein n=1 Tax=Eshraghiella crossota TaxID=45851 RepID=UPI003AB3FAC6